MENSEFHKQDTLPNLTSGSSEHLVPPDHIGPYKIETLLSKGGMSYLYLGIEPEKKSPLVVKVLSPKFMTHPEMVQHFLKEADIIRMTDHPNIIKLFGQGKWENGLYIAMEFVQGISLKQFIMQQNLSLKSSLDIILQVSYALLHLHTHGVIHRDLKPENILITESGQVKVIDFGIAQLTYETPQNLPSQKSQFLGTPSYMSPEQRKDPLKVTFASDIFSLGVITYELIMGKLSYGSIQLSLLPKELRKIVEKALQPSPLERYQDIVDLITDISNYLKVQSETQESIKNGNVKDLWEQLEAGHRKLLPLAVPKWSPFDIGLAQSASPLGLNSYHDFYRFADQTYLTVLAKLESNQAGALADIGLLKGMVQTLIYDALSSSDIPFEPITFITKLNTMLSSDFAFHLMHLNPLENQFSFISCGFEPLVHLSASSSTPRFLSNDNPHLGTDSHHDFFETTENWHEGDILILHSFPSDLTKTLNASLPGLLQLSAQSQANRLSSELAQAAEPMQGQTLCIHRIT